MENVLVIPLTILRSTGTIPFPITSKISRLTKVLFKLIIFTIIANGFVLCGFRVSVVIGDLEFPNKRGKEQGVFILAMVNALDSFMTLRGPLALSVFLLTSHQMEHFLHQINTATNFTFAGQTDYQVYLRRWTKWTKVSTILVSGVLVFWEVVSWTLAYIGNNNKFKLDTKNDIYSQAYKSVGLKIPIWMDILWWILSGTTCIFLSQIVYVLILISGKIMADSVGRLNFVLKKEIYQLDHAPEKLLGSKCFSLPVISHALLAYRDLQIVAESASNVLGSVFCALYIVDVMTAICYIASILTADDMQRVNYAGLAIFSIYTCCFIFTWIDATEKSEEFHQNISRLANALQTSGNISQIGSDYEVLRVKEMLNVFQAGGKEYLEFGGLRLLRASRSQILATFTGLASLGILAKDIFAKDPNPLIDYKVFCSEFLNNGSLRQE